MRCGEARRLMQAIIAGDARAADEERLAEHVQACPACAEQWRVVRNFAEVVRAVQPEEVRTERDLASEVMEELVAAPGVDVLDAQGVGGTAGASWAERVFGSKLAQAAGAVLFVGVCAGMLMMTMPRLDVLTGAMGAMTTAPMP